MKKRSLESYKSMLETCDRDKLIEMNYELSKKLCEIEEFIDKELKTLDETQNFIGVEKIKWSYEGMKATYKGLKNIFFEE